MSCCAPAGIYNITCNQGATFSRTLTWRDAAKKAIDITGYTARMQVRSTADSAIVVIELTTDNGRIDTSTSPLLGQVSLSIAAVDTAALAPGLYVYDLELVSPAGDVNRIIEGNFVVKAEVTR
jgi:hypothetical protein